ncbi:MAG: hypothetical protein HY650_06045 [Acidobacteria bacterium]|nr:hypothetical protein [Acidobacteriota bacterium]
MTVCIAALCTEKNQPVVIVASDRMLTAGDIEFEPMQSKIYQLGPRLVALTAGDAAVQASVCRDTATTLQANSIGSATDAAQIYARTLNAYRCAAVEKSVLNPHGLDFKAFHDQQRNLAPDVVARLTEELAAFRLNVATIVAGIDSTGGHIYVINESALPSCNDTVGFAAIGYGSWHAESQFMFARYTVAWPVIPAFMLTYIAKKRAEVAPGVGEATDMAILSGRGFVRSEQTVLYGVQGIYQKMRSQQEKAVVEAYKELTALVEESMKPSAITPQQQQGTASEIKTAPKVSKKARLRKRKSQSRRD